MDDLLNSMGLQKFADAFKENEIDTLETLILLTPDMLKEIIVPIGPRARLCSKITELKRAQDIQQSVEQADITVNNTSIALNNTTSTDVTEEPDVDDPGTPTLGASTPKRKSQFTNSPNKYKKLYNLLESSTDGKTVIHQYNQNGLDHASRKILCNKILQNEMQGDQDHRISTQRFMSLSQEVVECFPKEDASTYYIPYMKDVLNGQERRRCAKGKLWDRYHNIRRSLKACGLLQRNNASTSSNMTQSVSATDDDDVQELLQWLKHTLEPWCDVQKNWAKTSKSRLATLLNNIDTDQRISTYIQGYPVLKQPLGYTLIDIDFQELYPNKSNKLFGVWPSLSENIITYVRGKGPKDAATKALLMELDESDSGSIPNGGSNQDLKTVLCLMLLANIFPPMTVRCKNKIQWRPSRKETQQGFILHIKTIGELQGVLESRRKKLQELKLTAQPLTVVVGLTLGSITAAYVCVDQVRYKIETPLKAIDTCFKAFHALHANYPEEVKQVWLFIQKFVYEVTTPWDGKYVAVNTLINDLKNYEDS